MILLMRIDDRLIHGQVVVGWGQPLDLQFIVLVDDDVAESDWEQELYRLGVPPDMTVFFHSVESAAKELSGYELDVRRGIVLTGSIATMKRLVAACNGVALSTRSSFAEVTSGGASAGTGGASVIKDGRVRSVNIGGVHHAPDRIARLRYVFLTEAEEELLRSIEAMGVEVSAQDVPSARPVPLSELLSSTSDG